MSEHISKKEPRIFRDLDEMFSHNKRGDLWLLIDNKVYDVSEFKHPGNMAVLIQNAGMDATQQFEDIGHRNAEEHMERLYIGDYVYDDGQAKKMDDYPGQRAEPEYSLAARIGLACFIMFIAYALFTFIDSSTP